MDVRGQERRIQTACLLLLTAVALAFALYFLRPVLIPFVLAIFLVYCLVPVIDLQMRVLNIRRPFAVVTTILLGSVLVVLLWLLVWQSVTEMSANIPRYETQLQQLLDDAGQRLPLEHLGIDNPELKSLVSIPRESVQSLLGRLITAIRTMLSSGVLVVIFMIFIMAGKRRVRNTGSLFDEIESRVKKYLLTKVLVSATTGFLVGLTLYLFGIDFAPAFGVLAFFLNFIPSVGSVVATLLPLPVVMIDPELGWFAKSMAFGIPGIIQFLVGNIIEPRIMGKSLGLHPVVILMGLIFFGMIWGIIGMFLATPIIAVLRIILKHIEFTAPVADLLAGDLDGLSGGRASAAEPETG